MAIRTSFTELFQVAHPLVLAPMGGVSGGALAARKRFALGQQSGDPDVGLVWGGEGTDLITAVEPAGELAGQIIAQAKGCCAAPHVNWITRPPCNWI